MFERNRILEQEMWTMRYLIYILRKKGIGKGTVMKKLCLFLLFLFFFSSFFVEEDDMKPKTVIVEEGVTIKPKFTIVEEVNIKLKQADKEYTNIKPEQVVKKGIRIEVMDWIENRYGMSAINRIMDWQDLITHNRELPERDQLKLVNDFFNEIDYYTDNEIWGKTDYWATPVEMLAVDGADCEDYAIAKYFTLREMGIPAEKLRITYVKALELDQAHMVLFYYEHEYAKPVVLDNLIGQIRPASERQDLAPVYGFNGDGLWLAKSRGRGRKVGGSERISLWQNLTTKMEKEHGVISM
ncbi:transglutaminase-like cysteine peptidase [Patescibacteria group bacterium]